MKIGVIYCAYNAQEYVKDSLTPWILAKDCNLGSNNFIITALSVPFEKFEDPRTDDTVKSLRHLYDNKLIDHTIIDNNIYKETEARTLALKYLISKEIDLVIQVDADEFYSQKDISNIFSFVSKNPFISCFKGSLKNYIFNEKTFLKKPFNPMRIHRIKTVNGLIANNFWDDNNLLYKKENDYFKDIDLPHITIPQNIAWVKHMSWLSNERSKKKIEYQTSRGWKCTFKWNNSENKLELDLENIILSGEEIPEIELEKD